MTTLAEYNELAGKLDDLDIGILCLNAGVSRLATIENISDQYFEDIWRVNALQVAYLSKALVQKMLNRDKRCAILITSSIAAQTLMPGIASYSATKAAVSNYGECLNFELERNVDVTVWEPGYVNSNIHLAPPPKTITLDADVAVADVLRDLGKQRSTTGSLIFEWLPKSRAGFTKNLHKQITAKQDVINHRMAEKEKKVEQERQKIN